MHFSELLDKFMQQAQLSTTELAKHLQINRHTVRRWRSGEIARPNCKSIIASLKYLKLNRYQCQQLLRAAGCSHVPMSILLDSPEQPLSPFVVGMPITHPAQFCGRETVIKKIASVWRYLPLQNIAVIGQARCGKSSLLHYLKQILPQQLFPDYRVILIDFKEARMRKQSSLLSYLLNALELPVLTDCSLIHFEEILGYHTIEHPTLILMDDIDYGLASDDLPREFWLGIRSIQHNYCYGRLGFLLSSKQEPAKIAQDVGKSSPFFNVFGYQVDLAPFTDKEAQNLINRSPIKFSQADRQKIIREAAGAPERLQSLCLSHLHQLNDEV